MSTHRYSDKPSGEYRDESPWPMDLRSSDGDESSSASELDDPLSNGIQMTPTNAPSNVPPGSSFSRTAYSDDPSSTTNQPYRDEEANAVFVNGTGPSSAPASYHRKTLLILLIGICMGVIAMIALLLGGAELEGSPLGKKIHGFNIEDNFADDDGTAMEDAGFEPAFYVEKSLPVNENDQGNNPAPEQKEEAVTVTVQNSPPDQPAQVQPAPAVEQVQPAPVEQVQPAPVPAASSNPNQPEQEADIEFYCDDCPWRAGRYNCGQRVNFLVATYQITAAEAKVGLLKQGHCDINKQQDVITFLDKSGTCRTKCRPGDTPFEDFCGNCEWRNSGWDCFYRLKHLAEKFDTGALVAMQGEMKLGHCIDSKTEEEKQALKDQGLELWCGICQFKGDYCDRNAKSLDAKLALLADGKCTLPPLCETRARLN